MKRVYLAFAILCAALPTAAFLPCAARAQSSPGLYTGQVPTAAQWNSFFAAKQDFLNYTPVNRAGDTMLGPLVTFAPTTASAGLNLPQGAAPNTPVNGDLWTTSSGIFVQINGATLGPLAGTSAGSFAATVPLSVTFPSGVATYALNYNSTLTVDGSNNLGIANALTIGTHLTGTSYNGSSAVTIGTDATSANTANTIMARDGSGNVAFGTATGSLTGHASLDLAVANNLSDLASASTARANLSLTPGIGLAISGSNLNLQPGTGSVIGGVEAISAISHEFITSIVSGVPALAQPSFGDISGSLNLATQVTGNLSVSNLNGGAGASSSTFWRGDGTWFTPTISNATTGTTVAVSSNGNFPLLIVASATNSNQAFNLNSAFHVNPSTGALFAPVLSTPQLNLSAITGSTQCLHADSFGNVTGSGSDCLSAAGYLPLSGGTMSGNIDMASNDIINVDEVESAAISLGTGSSVDGEIFFFNSTNNNSVTIAVPSAPSANYSFNLPTTAGISGNCMLSGGGGTNPMTWGSCGGGLAVGTTTISGGTSGDIEFNNAGVLGEKGVTGTGSVVLATSPNVASLTVTSAFNATGLVTSADLAATAVSAASYGSSTSIPSFTVNAEGQLTAASGNAVVAPAGTLSGTTLNSTVVNSSLTSVGTLASGAVPVSLLTGTLGVANGGTGATSMSANAIPKGNGTSPYTASSCSDSGTLFSCSDPTTLNVVTRNFAYSSGSAHQLMILNSGGSIQAAATTTTDGVIGINFAGGGITVVDGQFACIFDGSTTAGDWVTISSTVAGDCHDTGSATRATGQYQIGQVLSTNGSAGSYIINIENQYTPSGSGGSGTVNSGSSGQVGYYATTGTAISGESLSALLDASLGSTQGSVLYRGASTWAVIPPGTSGYFFETQGASANPTWAPASGGSGCSTGGSSGNLLTSNGVGGCTTDTNSSLTNGALALGSSGTAGSVAMGNATSGTITLQPTTGALGTVTATIQAATDVIVDRSTTDTLTNKTISGSANALSNIANASLANSSVTIGSTSVSLGATAATISGLSLVAPVLGVATATSINKVAITAPATSATLTIANGKTLTVSNTLTLAGTDSSTLNIGTGGTLGTAAYQATGTSGGALPFLNGTNAWSGAQTFGEVLGTVTTQSGTTYTFAAADCGTEVTFSSNSAVTATIPATLPAGCNIAVAQLGTAKISVNGSAVSAATLLSAHSYTGTSAQYAIIGINIEANSGGSAAIALLSGDGS